MNCTTKTISYDQRARFFWILLGASVLSLLIYIYAVNATARNIAMGRALDKQIATISANFDSLEFDYIELKNNITIELAYQYGFREAKSPLYVSRANPQSLSFNTINQ